MKNGRKKSFYVFLIIFLCAVAVGIGYTVKLQSEKKKYEDLAKEAHVTEMATPTPTPEETAAPTPESTAAPTEEAEKPVIPIDFASLQAENSEIYAWIQIPDTAIDYPVAQRIGDDSYYLNHTIDVAEGLPGSIYTETQTSMDFSDYNTVIYGHKMKNGTMFGTLTQYADPEYMAAHPEIYIYTPDHIFTYEIFAAVTYDNRHILNSFDFSSTEGRQAYLDSIQNVRNFSTHFRDDVQVGTEDRILTLSTCNGNDDQRFLLEAVLKNEQ